MKVKIRIPRPHPGQMLVRREARRWNFLCAGRRWYKSTLLSILGVEAALKGKEVFIGCPTYDQVRILWNYTRKMVPDTVARFHQTRLEALYVTGGKTIFRSLDDPNNAKGHNADLVLLDEAAQLKSAAWFEVVLPMLLTTGGDAWLSSTPLGRNWFWKEHQEEGDDRMSWQIPTVGCKIGTKGDLLEEPNQYANPHISFGEIKQYFGNTPQQVFRQEILAQFIEDNAQVFRGVRKCVHEIPEKRIGPYLFGVDLAKTVDFSVFTVLNQRTKQVEYFDRFNQVDYITQENRLLALYERYKPEVIVVEANAAGEPFIEQLERRGLPIEPFYTTNASKKNIVDALALAFERREIKIPENKVLINELLAFESKRLPSGKLAYSAPSGQHDDMVMSLALAWYALKKEEANKVEIFTSNFLTDYRG